MIVYTTRSENSQEWLTIFPTYEHQPP